MTGFSFENVPGSEEIIFSQIWNSSDIDIVVKDGLSFFDPYLQYYIKEILEIGGEAYVSRTSDGAISGIFQYDESEKTGTIYTKSKLVFDCFYQLKQFNFLFAEIRTDLESEIYDIYTVELGSLDFVHRFSYEISLAEVEHADQIEQFMVSTYSGLNRRWVSVALKNGDKCFIVRFGDEIAGLGWLSFVGGIGRLHSLYVKPQFRRMGIGKDLLYARLLWLKSKNAHSAFSEISRFNSSSSRIAMKGHMIPSRQIFQYFKKPPEKVGNEMLANDSMF